MLDDQGFLRLLKEDFVDLVGEVGHGELNVVHKIVERLRLCNAVNPEQSSVAVLGAERRNFLCHPKLCAFLNKWDARVLSSRKLFIPISNHVLHDEEREGIRTGPAPNWKCVSDVGIRHIIVSHADLRSSVNGLLKHNRFLTLGRNFAKVRVGKFDEFIVIDCSSTNHHHASSSVVGLDVILDHSLIHCIDIFGGTKNGTAKRGSTVCGLMEAIKYHLFNLALNFLHLAKNGTFLPINEILIEVGILEDVGKDLHCLSSIFLKNAGKKYGLLPGGISVQVTTHVLNLHLQSRLGAGFGPFEEHVLKKVSNSVVLLSFVAAAGIHPNSNGDRFTSTGLRRHTHTVRQLAHRCLWK
mmetsp:Transcript_27330/g.66470  ORF Transcript_27330/g.66470 Transcript_27330/m.66470 type:complete len:354 (-) Transcript_27330:110-1171(-)